MYIYIYIIYYKLIQKTKPGGCSGHNHCDLVPDVLSLTELGLNEQTLRSTAKSKKVKNAAISTLLGCHHNDVFN